MAVDGEGSLIGVMVVAGWEGEVMTLSERAGEGAVGVWVDGVEASPTVLSRSRLRLLQLGYSFIADLSHVSSCMSPYGFYVPSPRLTWVPP